MANPSKVLAKVVSIEPFGDGVYQVTLGVPSRYTRYLPGQFLHLTLDEFDPTNGYWPESRVFSIASEPRKDFVTIVYSVKGVYTKRMEKELVPGREIWLKFPYGDFIIDVDQLKEGPVVLVAGGTGVSPYWPFLKSLDSAEGTVHLFYGVRKPEHLLFQKDLEEFVEKPWFHMHLMIEEGVPHGLPHQSGRLSISGITETLGNGFGTAHYYLSGPPMMIRTFKDDLISRNIKSSQIHIDEWE